VKSDGTVWSVTTNDTVYARSQDAAGNLSTESTYAVININKSAPNIAISYSTTEPTNQNVLVTVDITDNVAIPEGIIGLLQECAYRFL
jgi:hypothetical protein